MFLFRMMQLIEAGPAPEPGAYYFCEIAPDILSDRSFIPAFLDYLRSADDLVSRVAFEFREADLIDMDEAGADSLGTLVDLGFHLCVSQLSNVDVEAERLVEGGVRFVKIEAEVPMAAITNDAEAAWMRRFTSALDDAGIELIVTGIANEQLLVEILDFDIEYGQGPLFGDPRKQSAAPAAAAEGRRGRA
jgi:cyclic-di-GMP phosphodiesterase TipF (flagellum assembly factor)